MRYSEEQLVLSVLVVGGHNKRRLVMSLTVDTIQLGHMYETGHKMTEAEYHGFVYLCARFDLLDCNTYEEAYELMLLYAKQRPFQTMGNVCEAAKAIKEKHNA
jgi:hypothetical protein